MTDFSVRHDVVGPNEIQVVDLVAGNELVNLDGAGRLQRDVLELVFADLKIAVRVDLVALDDVFG